MRIGLVGCVKTKRPGAFPARDLYVSELFKGRREYVEKSCDRWFILSAKHGALDPDELIETYDQTLWGSSDVDKAAWTERVVHQLEAALGDLGAHSYELHAGRDYWAFGLRAALESAGASVDYPVGGSPLGEQLAFYARARSASPPTRITQPSAPSTEHPQQVDLVADVERAREAGRRLLEAWRGTGIFGHREMPESMLPRGMRRGSIEHSRFITLTVAIDYMRDAAELWAAARVTFEDSQTAWVFDPQSVVERRSEVEEALRRHEIVRRPEHDVGTWIAVSGGLVELADGDPIVLAAHSDMSATRLLAEIRKPEHRRRFPRLRGAKIGPLWVRMLADEVGVPLQNLGDVPIPVDVHIARATFACGALRGTASAPVTDLAARIAEVWGDACEHLPAYPLQLDQALWLQSRDGCSARRGDRCPNEAECVLSDLCVGGRIEIREGTVDVETGSGSGPAPPAAESAPRSERRRSRQAHAAGGIATEPRGLWARISELAGQEFSTRRGLAFRYNTDGQYIEVLARRGARIPRQHLERAASGPRPRLVSDLPKDVWGKSYVFAILTDERLADSVGWQHKRQARLL